MPNGCAGVAPACDVFSRDGDLVVELDLPGGDPASDVRVTVEDGARGVGLAPAPGATG